MEGLSPLEQAALDKLIAGDHPVLQTLRHQASRASLRAKEYTGVGVFCSFDVLPGTPTVAGGFELEDVTAEVAGFNHGAGFILFVREGVIELLEGFSYDEPWPDEIRDFEIAYVHEPRLLPDPRTSGN